MNTKPWYKSRTIMVSGVTGVLAVLQLMTDAVTDPDLVALFVGVVGALQIYLRAVTERPLS